MLVIVRYFFYLFADYIHFYRTNFGHSLVYDNVYRFKCGILKIYLDIQINGHTDKLRPRHGFNHSQTLKEHISIQTISPFLKKGTRRKRA